MQWFENEDFWQTFYPYMFGEHRMAAAPGEVERVVALSGVVRGRVLDLCCGPARHSLILAQEGFQVTGVDRSPFSSEQSSRSNRRRGGRAGGSKAGPGLTASAAPWTVFRSFSIPSGQAAFICVDRRPIYLICPQGTDSFAAPQRVPSNYGDNNE